MKKITLLAIAFSIALAANNFAQTPLTYKDSQGRTVTFPYGEISFADRVVERRQGNPPSTAKTHTDPNNTLGTPDYKSGIGSLSLGRNGSVTIEFTDNYLVDIEGPDLWIFEIGPAVESTKLAISKDGRNWIEIGTIRGSTSGIDIAPFISRGDRFSFVRITDNNNGSGQYGGADIDAVGATGSTRKDSNEMPENMPVNTNGSECCNKLKIETFDNRGVIVDLSNGKSLDSFRNVKRVSFACDNNNSTNTGNRKLKTPLSEVMDFDDFRFVSINGRAVGEATRPCRKSLLECGTQIIGFYGVEGVGGPADNPNFREETFEYKSDKNKNYSEGERHVGIYLLTQTGFEDDSLAGERLRLEFVRQGDVWIFVMGGRQFQCARGSNAGQWTKEFCP